MPSIIHEVEIFPSVERVVCIATPKSHRAVENKYVYQAKCICGWKGPRRTMEYEAQEDAAYHELNPVED